MASEASHAETLGEVLEGVESLEEDLSTQEGEAHGGRGPLVEKAFALDQEGAHAILVVVRVGQRVPWEEVPLELVHPLQSALFPAFFALQLP